MKNPFFLLASLALLSTPVLAEQRVSGLILPRDEGGFYLRNSDGIVEVEWNEGTAVALEVSSTQLSELEENVMPYKIPLSDEVFHFVLPAGPVTAVVMKPDRASFLEAMGEYDAIKRISEVGLRLFFGFDGGPGTVSMDGHFFAGRWNPSTTPRTMNIAGRPIELSMHEGEETAVLLFGKFSTENCQPFVNRATVLGEKNGAVLVAKEIHFSPIGDQVAKDDPTLPRYLFIGDSISGNYDAGLRSGLAGKANIHHPPTNCSSSDVGRERIVEWLGAYTEPGRAWDVISFNHGHWDAARASKTDYQANLEVIITELKKTGAKLVWVTTTPLPPLAVGSISPRVIVDALNPWAAEVMARHPEISVCDLWQFVKDDSEGIFEGWYEGDDLHFNGPMGDALGEHLAEDIRAVLGE